MLAVRASYRLRACRCQEPGRNSTEILNTLKYVRPGNGFEPNFSMFEKSEVNGENEIPLYTYLKSFCASPIDEFYTEGSGIYYTPLRNTDIRWNFEKFLINKKGHPVSRYHHSVIPHVMTADVKVLLEEGNHTDVTGTS